MTPTSASSPDSSDSSADASFAPPPPFVPASASRSATAPRALSLELERMRARLLDLSARNPLLSYGFPRGKSIRIVDEVPALVLERMVGNGGFTFSALEADEAAIAAMATGGGLGGAAGAQLALNAGEGPSAMEAESDLDGSMDGDAVLDADDPALLSQSTRARRQAAAATRRRREQSVASLAQAMGINPSYDLPAVEASAAAHHGDRKLQTLLTPGELEGRLQKIQALAVTAIQESGANMLHLLFGFVEWTDVAGGKPRMAPLVLLPVTLARLDLDRATHTFPYTVAASGEDWDTNVTLVEKCRKEFGFVLPVIEAEENLETYFTRVEEVLRTGAPGGWRLRRQLTLGLVSFGKILMWRDLDLATWPTAQPLLTHALLREVLGDGGTTVATGDDGDGEDDTASFAELRTEAYRIDQLPSEFGPVPPIVVPADSSQHSVLVDVQRGHSLVVQGPPGTGKSQTITNIIADAIAARKKILFVAEKKAALDVVARRLIDAGLGAFCLPLHSHTSNKREFLDGLQERIAITDVEDSAADLASVEQRLAEAREVLTGHVDRLHAPFGSLGDTAFSIFWRTRRLRSELPAAVTIALRGVTVANAIAVTTGELARQRATLGAFGAAYAAVLPDIAPGESHPWFGVTRGDLSFDDTEALLDLARDARTALAAAETTRLTLQVVTDGANWPTAPETLTPLFALLKGVVPPAAGIPGALIAAIHARAGVASVRAAVAASDRARRAWAAIPGPWGVPGALTPAAHAEAREALATAATVFGPDRTVAALKTTTRLLTRALDQLDATATLSAAAASELGLALPLSVGLRQQLVGVAAAADALPEGALALRSAALAAPTAAERVAALAARATAILTIAATLDERFAPAMRPTLPELRTVAGALAEAPSVLPWLLSGRYRHAVRTYRRMRSGAADARSASRATLTADVDALIRHLTTRDAFLVEPALAQLFGAAADGLHSPFAAASACIAWTRQAATAFRGAGDAGRALADAVWSAPAADWQEAGAQTSAAPTAREAAATLPITLADVAVGTRTLGVSDAAAAETATDVATGLESVAVETLRAQLTEWRTSTTAVTAVATAAGMGEPPAATSYTIGALHDLLARVTAAWDADAALAAHTATFHDLGLAVPPSVVSADAPDILAAVRGALTFLAQFHEVAIPAAIVDWLATGRVRAESADTATGTPSATLSEPAARVAAIHVNITTVERALTRAAEAEERCFAAGGIEATRWYGDWPDGAALALRVARFDRAILAAATLPRYGARMRARAAVLASPLPAAVELLETGAIAPTELPRVYDYVLARTLAECVLRDRPELDRFSGAVHETRREQFGALDAEYLRLMQRTIAERASQTPRVRGVSYGAVRELTEEGLIKHEIGKTRRHVPIREMFRRAGRAIQALKPCIMMGPQAVAQYLPPGLFHFDLVVMDEASQMRPEDALGAIARGAQLVVVGDPKQLGPTDFFTSTAAEEDDEIEEEAAMLASQANATHANPSATATSETDATDSDAAGNAPRAASVLERSESILLAAARRYPMRMLQWHYRSRYPQLITFSNEEFYGGDLILFPHPGTERAGDGVNFRAVEGAVYGASINRTEAATVVAAVRRHAVEHPERTLLVVTMNQKQRELVDALIQDAEKDDLALAAFRARHEGTLEPFGVKNLENVQGDERDVIYVSVTYGPNARGTLSQGFGPVNSVGGERRLNVLFTRAKYRLDVFCSFDPTTLRVTEASPRGLCVLRDYLRYAKEGTLATGRFTGREPDSDFEREVATALREHGYDVHPQVGVAGYFLDMAVVDPRAPGRYLLAIECDGATYHSAKSARDRDRLRQGVLEGLGWSVHRIWSTEWFRDPRGETSKILRRSDALLSA